MWVQKKGLGSMGTLGIKFAHVGLERHKCSKQCLNHFPNWYGA